MVLVSKGYKAFRQKYRPFFRTAKREMDTPLQKGLLDNVAAMAFNAGWHAARRPSTQPTPPVKMRVWKGARK